MQLSSNGVPLTPGDRVVYVCECGRPECRSGQYAVILDPHALTDLYPGIVLTDTRVYVQFADSPFPSVAEGMHFVHQETPAAEVLEPIPAGTEELLPQSLVHMDGAQQTCMAVRQGRTQISQMISDAMAQNTPIDLTVQVTLNMNDPNNAEKVWDTVTVLPWAVLFVTDWRP